MSRSTFLSASSPRPVSTTRGGVQYFSLNVKNDQGANVGVRQRSILDDNFFVYVPDIPTIFGARYGAYLDQSVSFGSTGTNAGTATNFGLVNTVISPVNLSWDLGHGFYASAGFTFYPPGPNYHTTDGNHINRPQSSFEPGFGLSYLANGLNLTIHPLLDFNTVDPANGYLSGSVFVMDFSGTYKYQKFEFGGAGTIVAQFSDDKQHGVTVGSVPGVRGYGNRAQGVNLGPLLGYDLGVATARVYYTRAVYGRNIATDDRFYFRLDFPVGGQRTARAPATDSEGAR